MLVLLLAVATAASAGVPRALDGERLGLFRGSEYRLADGRCSDCPVSPAALFYFQDETIAVPKDADPTRPSLVWVGSPELLKGADGKLPLALAPRLSSNRSWYDASTAAFFAGRTLRVRGRTGEDGSFVARTIWPEDFSLSLPGTLQPLGPDGVDAVVRSAEAGPSAFATQLLWRRAASGGPLAGSTAIAMVMSGAQADDDEAHGGHFALATGRLGAQGGWADWMVNNFYNLDFVSEKGIVAARVPMDNYLMDLNSGQAYYRPNGLLVLLLRDERTARRLQRRLDATYERFYRHDVLYHHSAANCAGLSVDALRELGWAVPLRGPSGYLKAMAAFFYVGLRDRSLTKGTKTFDYLSEEQTRLLPRVTFAAAGDDLLRLLRAERAPGSEYERQLLEDAEAVTYLHVAQLPSSRARGTLAVASFGEYQQRVPADESQWKIIPLAPRPFPLELRDGQPLPRRRSWALPVAGGALALLGLACYALARALQRLFGRS